MTTVPCPRCGMLVGLDQEVCSHCRTPRDDMEMEEGRALVRREELRQRRRPKLIAAGVAAAVLLTTAWLLRGLVLGPLLVAWSDFQIEVEKTRQPKHWVKGRDLPPTVVPNAHGPAAAPSAHAQVAVSSFIYLNTSGPAPLFPVAPAPETPSEPAPPRAPPVFTTPARETPPPDAEPQPGPGELHVRGTVYDLATARPLRGVTIKFHQRRTGSNWEAMTNALGRYRIVFFGNDSDDIVATIEAPGYRKGLLEDRDPPYRERTVQARISVIAETTDSDLEAVPLRHKVSEQVVEFDFVLVPLSAR